MELQAGDVVALKSEKHLTPLQKFTIGKIHSIAGKRLAVLFWFDYDRQELRKMDVNIEALEKY